MPNISLTDALLRAYLGPKGGLQPVDAPPPHPPSPAIEIDYPHISTQPEYKVAADKLNHFAKQKEEAEAKLADLHQHLAAKAKRVEPNAEDAITKAEALLAGEEHDVDLHAEIQAANKLIDALRKAVEAQHQVLRQVVSHLSRAAGSRYQDEHRQRVKRLMAAVNELNAANRSEMALRWDLDRLGYTGETLPAMNLRSVEDPTEVCGNTTYYWYREAERYSQTAAEAANEVREARLKSMLGN